MGPSRDTPPPSAPNAPVDARVRLGLFGAVPDTGNLGVTALMLSVLDGVSRRLPEADVVVFDDRHGVRPDRAQVGERAIAYRRCGAAPTRRVYRIHSLANARASGWLGGLGHPVLGEIRAADAILDVSGGDSFTDLYGGRRLRRIVTEKQLALAHGRALILLPQTIGPFARPRAEAVATAILRDAALVFTRDGRSHARLQTLLGAAYDPARHRRGVDLAFALPARAPERPLPERLHAWLHAEDGPPVVGCNVSGLLANGADAAQRFGLRANYVEALVGFLERVLVRTDARVLLVPHVMTGPGHHEHDPDACSALARTLYPIGGDRVRIVPSGYDPCETKAIIAATDFFCATRMHAAIAALSSGVPTAALAYSEKTGGVFDTCGVGDHVVDPRALDTDDVVDRLWTSWYERRHIAATLANSVPRVKARAEAQMDEIVARCAAAPARRREAA